MERECKNLEFGGEVNKGLVDYSCITKEKRAQDYWQVKT
jgi:hypothetical protein